MACTYTFSLSKAIKQTADAAQEVEQIDAEIVFFKAYLESLKDEKKDAQIKVKFNEIVKEIAENLAEDEAFCVPMDHADYRVLPRERKTRVDVLTPFEAVKSCKTSKNHKLKPKAVNRDKTKTPKSKTFSLNKKYSSNKKEAAVSF